MNYTAAGSALAFLAVLTLADGINSNALSIVLGLTEARPGFWNRGTTHLILSGVSSMPRGRFAWSVKSPS
jgi:hypothetical protein